MAIPPSSSTSASATTTTGTIPATTTTAWPELMPETSPATTDRTTTLASSRIALLGAPIRVTRDALVRTEPATAAAPPDSLIPPPRAERKPWEVAGFPSREAYESYLICSTGAGGGAGGGESTRAGWDPLSQEYLRAPEAMKAAGGAGGGRRALGWSPTTQEYWAGPSGGAAAGGAASGATPFLARMSLTSRDRPAAVLCELMPDPAEDGAPAPAAAAKSAKENAERDLARLLARISTGRPLPGPQFSADSFARAVLGVGFHEPITRPPAVPSSYRASAAVARETKIIPPFRAIQEGESEEAYARAKAAYDSVRSSKPLCTARDFGKGALVLNTKDNISRYFQSSKEDLRALLKGVLIYMASFGKAEDLSSEESIAAASAIFPDIESTVTHLMPVVEGLLSKGMCFGFAMSFAAYLTQEKDLKKTEEGFTAAFMGLDFKELAPLIQFLYLVRPSFIRTCLREDDKERYESKLHAPKEKESISRKLVFIEAPPHAEVRYSGGPSSILEIIERCISEKTGTQLSITYSLNTMPESTAALCSEYEAAYLEAQISMLMRKHKNHPVVICFESHALCFYTTDDGLYLLNDGNKGCKLFASEEEAKAEIAKHVRSYGRDRILDCHVFLNKYL